MGSGVHGVGVLLPKAVVLGSQCPVLQEIVGDQWQKTHPYTQRGFIPRRVGGSYQPSARGLSRWCPGQGLV